MNTFGTEHLSLLANRIDLVSGEVLGLVSNGIVARSSLNS